MSHSESFIQEMKTKLLDEQNVVRTELESTAEYIDGEWQVKVPEYEQDEEVNAMEVDQATALAAVTQANAERLREVTAALARIESGTYGQTAAGQEIPEDRLRANPAATTVVNE